MGRDPIVWSRDGQTFKAGGAAGRSVACVDKHVCISRLPVLSFTCGRMKNGVGGAPDMMGYTTTYRKAATIP